MHPQLGSSHHRLVSACRTAGIDAVGAQPVRVAANAVWRLPAPGIIAKIYPASDVHGPDNAVACARWLADSNIPAVRLHHDRPAKADDGSTVLFWEDLGDHRAATGHEVGRVLKTLHNLPVPSWMQIQNDPMPNVNRHLDGSAWFDPADINALREYTQRVSFAWSCCVDRDRLVPTHGDAWPGNFAATSDGVVHMLDLESVLAAPRERDLATVAAKTLSINQFPAETHIDLCASYGSDVTRHADYPIYRRIEELKACAYALFAAQENQAARPYARYRADCLLDRVERPWTWPGLPVDYRADATDEAAPV